VVRVVHFGMVRVRRLDRMWLSAAGIGTGRIVHVAMLGERWDPRGH